MTAQAFRRVAIVNRGEPAMRLINAVREWNAQGLAPLRTIAIYTAVDRTAMFVREADEAVLLGPDDPDYLGPSPYLDYGELRRALTAARADAVWPGWGFVSEKAEFARLCRDMDIIFIGPSPEVSAGSATRSPPSCSPRRSACRWRRGRTGRWPTSPPPASTPNASATRS